MKKIHSCSEDEQEDSSLDSLPGLDYNCENKLSKSEIIKINDSDDQQLSQKKKCIGSCDVVLHSIVNDDKDISQIHCEDGL